MRASVRKPNRQAYVYALHAPSAGLLKFGYSLRPSDRLRAMRRLHADVVLAGMAPTSLPLVAEIFLHRYLHEAQGFAHSEWYPLTLQTLDVAERIAQGEDVLSAFIGGDRFEVAA